MDNKVIFSICTKQRDSRKHLRKHTQRGITPAFLRSLPVIKEHSVNQCAPPGYSYLACPRSTGTGGGIAVIYNTVCSVKITDIPPLTSFECMACILSGHISVMVVLIYRLSSTCPAMVVLGDLNIHDDRPE